jgi:hypothetical protein
MKRVNNINIQQGGKYSNEDTKNITQISTSPIDSNERSTVTYSDTLQTMDKVQEKLRGYERVPDIDLVEIGTPVRYITWKYGAMRFCIGGILIAKHPNYCKLTNYRKDIQWNVKKEHLKNKYDKSQTFKTIFYKKCSGANIQEGGGSGVNEKPKYTTIQAREIEKFYKQKKQNRKKQEWLKDNIYSKLKNIRFF